MGNPTIQLSIWEKLDFFPALVNSLGSTLFSVILYPFSRRDTPTASTFKRRVIISLMISVFGRLSTRQLQYLAGDSSTLIKKWAKSQNLPTIEFLTLPDGTTQAFYLGHKNASSLILYFHGGGFALPTSGGHLEFLKSLSKMADQNNKPAAVLLLDYDTAPTSQYPRQLTQAVELLRYLITTLNHAPSSIILAGDSAGGSLILGLLGHILHPHPSIPPLTLKEPLRGAAMSSPVVDFDFSKASFVRARLIDPAPVSTLDRWMADYVGTDHYPEDFYLQAGRAPASWWEGSEGVVEEILIAAAEKEGMVEDISSCARKIQGAHRKTTLFLAKDDIHAEPSIGIDVGFEEGDQAKVIKEWIVERL